MLLSVPLTMIFKIAPENKKEGRKYAILLSSDEDLDLMLEELKAKQEQESASE